MKTTFILTSTLKHLAVAAFLGFGLLLLRASDKSATAVKPAEVVIPRSAFTDDPQSGKDPFFPNSVRRQAVIARVAPTNAAPTSSLFTLLSLKGISGTKGQQLALINSATVAEGETAEIRSGPQIIKIRCLEIRERSVLLELAGNKEIREIKLRDGF